MKPKNWIRGQVMSLSQSENLVDEDANKNLQAKRIAENEPGTSKYFWHYLLTYLEGTVVYIRINKGVFHLKCPCKRPICPLQCFFQFSFPNFAPADGISYLIFVLLLACLQIPQLSFLSFMVSHCSYMYVTFYSKIKDKT